GYTYFLLKGIEKVRGEFSLVCFVYNLKRVLNIVGWPIDLADPIFYHIYPWGSMKSSRITEL
ncbi:MAG: hypothetical protein KAR18_07575, partial [Spirochaetes bacterium]|nr:hypothetical protein [Spirochaetota bacterium]